MEPLCWHLILISPPIHYSIAGDIADALLRWMYDALIGGFESVIGDVVDIGTEVFEHPQNYPYVQVTIDFFQKLAWVFLALGLVLAAMEAAIAYYNGRGDFGNVALNVIKSYAVCFFLTGSPILQINQHFPTSISFSVSTPQITFVLQIHRPCLNGPLRFSY